MNLKKFKRRIQKLFFPEQWSLLVCDPDGKALANLAPPKDRIWADPFPVEQDGRVLVFMEQQYNKCKGTLGYIELFEDMTHTQFTPILEKDYHLSFPNVFQVNNIWYMIPETHEHGAIDLYRAEIFPDKWVFDSTLVSGIVAVDSTIFEHDNRWWLFTSLAGQTGGLNESLYLFSSEAFPSCNWASHPMNPVVTGLQNSRMAGLIFRDQTSGEIFRPAQSCAKEYGEETHLNRITSLTCDTYREETIATIKPEKEFHAVCTHTFNKCDKYIVRDIKTRRFRI